MTDADAFKTGDVVRLKSGGRKMVVGWATSTSRSTLVCHWHDDDGCPQQGEYHPDEMVPVEPPALRDPLSPPPSSNK
ncbi:MAG TPA: DUF2158 domain-containing protein [Terriglobales bacterium]|nr:DUF2158 domain-containing protein [Terriglobales bacterium]